MLRGGPLAERRVIDLINRRFVPFYFNVGKGQMGYDESAAKYIAEVDERFAGDRVPTPPVWIISPEGELFTTIDNYADKHAFHAALVKMLDDHYEMGLPTPEEEAVLAAPMDEAQSKSATAWLGAARLHEELGRDDLARTAYELAAALAERRGDEFVHANLGLMRLARWKGDLDAASVAFSAAMGVFSDTDGQPVSAACKDDVVVEGAHLFLARGWDERARHSLITMIKARPTSHRLGEMHFYAGVAAFRLGEREWANFHWCWVLENLPDDRHYMRVYLAATADAMPYPNPELGGYKGDVKMISHAAANKARAAAMADYERLKDEF